MVTSARQAIAAQLGRFLYALHQIPVIPSLPKTGAPVSVAAWIRVRDRVEQQVYPHPTAYQVEWAAGLFDSMVGDPPNFDYQ